MWETGRRGETMDSFEIDSDDSGKILDQYDRLKGDFDMSQVSNGTVV